MRFAFESLDGFFLSLLGPMAKQGLFKSAFPSLPSIQFCFGDRSANYECTSRETFNRPQNEGECSTRFGKKIGNRKYGEKKFLAQTRSPKSKSFRLRFWEEEVLDP